MRISTGRKKKRFFHGNRHLKPEEVQKQKGKKRDRPKQQQQGDEQDKACASAKKLKLDEKQETDLIDDSSHLIILNSALFEQIIMRIGSCPHCKANIAFENKLENKKGFGYTFAFRCIDSDQEDNCFFSPFADNVRRSPGHQPDDVDLRMAFAFCEIGKGYPAMSTFATLMNMPPPLTKANLKR